MARNRCILITGSSGLIGSEAVAHFGAEGFEIVGIDNNMRADFFGPKGDTTPTLKWIKETVKNFTYYNIDIRNRSVVTEIVKQHLPQAIIHCAAQPSHDLAKDRPFDDFEVNAVGTLNLLEACRQYVKDSPFVFLSTNKVYGDAPNELPLDEQPLRYEYKLPEHYFGIAEDLRIDASLHSLFGASKLAADIVTQEYGHYFNIPTVCFRAGCMTGPHQAGVELHGFLNHLVKVAVDDQLFRIYGFKGKQVRDQLHCQDVITAIDLFIKSPKQAAVYNLGGGRESNASVLECISMIEDRLGRQLRTEFHETSRIGDHICYISDTRKFKRDYPTWNVTKPIDKIIDELVTSNRYFFRNTKK